jgi:hypothetical protein
VTRLLPPLLHALQDRLYRLKVVRIRTRHRDVMFGRGFFELVVVGQGALQGLDRRPGGDGEGGEELGLLGVSGEDGEQSGRDGEREEVGEDGAADVARRSGQKHGFALGGGGDLGRVDRSGVRVGHWDVSGNKSVCAWTGSLM